MTHLSHSRSDAITQPTQSASRQKATRRLAPPAPRPIEVTPYQPPLSETERRVLRLLVRGMTERRAAEVLDRSPNTVHVHVRNIYRKLSISSRKMLYKLVDARPELLDPIEPIEAGDQARAAA